MQEQVLAEASMMVPDTRQRLETALADLQQCLVNLYDMLGDRLHSACLCLSPCNLNLYIESQLSRMYFLCRAKAAKLKVVKSSNRQN